MAILTGTLPKAQNTQILIVYDNKLIGRKGATVIASSTAVEGNMGAENLLTENRSDIWRSGSVLTASLLPTPEITLTFSLALASPISIDWSSYHWSNNCLQWRDDYYIGDPDAAGILTGTTGWMNPIVQSEAADFGPGDAPSSFGPSDARITQMAIDRRLESFANQSTPILGIDYIRRRFDCTSGANGDVDFIDVGLCMGGLAWQPQIGIEPGDISLAPTDGSIKRRSAGRSALGVKRPTGSSVSIAFNHLTDFEAQTDLFTGMRKDEGALARVFLYGEPEDDKRIFFYDGFSFVGVIESFDNVAIDLPPGGMGGVFVEKNIKGLKFEETE